MRGFAGFDSENVLHPHRKQPYDAIAREMARARMQPASAAAESRDEVES